MIFLLGPPGAGKSTLGRAACHELGIRFVECSSAEEAPSADAVVVEVPWGVLADRRGLRGLRKTGTLVGLWSHPVDMQARSGLHEPLFTRPRGLKSDGGFGRLGTRCLEFRRLDRACDEVLVLVGLSEAEAVDSLVEALEELQEERSGTDLSGWVEEWITEHAADRRAARALGESMARYVDHLEAKGTSPRTVAGILNDLEPAGSLVFSYLSPGPAEVLGQFQDVEEPPCEFEYQRKYSDSPPAVARYRRSLQGFARFLREPPELGQQYG